MVIETVRGFVKKGFYAAVLVAFLIALFHAIKTYLDTRDAYVFPDYIYIDVVFSLFFLIECILYFVLSYMYADLFKKRLGKLVQAT